MSSIAFFTAQDQDGKDYVGQLITTDVAEIRVFIAYKENLRTSIEEITEGLVQIARDLGVLIPQAKKLIVAGGGLNGGNVRTAAQGRQLKGKGRTG